MKYLQPPTNVTIPDDFTPEDGLSPFDIVPIVAGTHKKTFQVTMSAGVQDLLYRLGIPMGYVSPPKTIHQSYTNSRDVLIPGTDKAEWWPLLSVLALAKYGPWDNKTSIPIWKSGDWWTETFANVDLISITNPLTSQPRKKSKYGVMAGTPEYYKIYREANREKWNGYQKAYYHRKKAENTENARKLKQLQMRNADNPELTTPSMVRQALRLDDILRDSNTEDPEA